ncbi:MAG: Cof-type HAD-IIB family hydrolase [Pseudomonadota bacterium]|nr:Cof-type HAD-IIB family hydrolase [Pseudomonadota bacterium]
MTILTTDSLSDVPLKMVVSDLDGTLLNSEHKLTKPTIDVIKALVEQGIQFMLATGRHYQDVYLIAQQLNVDMCLITSNGARVHNSAGELLYENHMPSHLVKKVLDLSEGFDVHRNLYQQEFWLVEEPHEALLAIHHESGFEYKITDFSEIDLAYIDKIYFTAEHDKLVELEVLLKQHLSEQLYITFTSPEYLEVMNLGVSKGQALKMVLKQRDLSSREVMALGDGMNDIEMLNLVGHAVVMENASNQVKTLLPNATLVNSNAADGVAAYLQKTILKID